MGASKKNTVGHRYYFGLHMGLGRGPIDELVQIKAGGKHAWSGSVTSNGSFMIRQPDLFGGDDGEGGINGTVHVLMGGSAQGVLAPLAAMLGGLVPAFRGVATLFYDGLICSMSTYPKPWSMRARRALSGWADDVVWYADKARITMTGVEIPEGPGVIREIRAMNPAHMLYQCITDPDWGRGLAASRINDSVWRTAADRLYSEGFGMCLKWSRQGKLSEFMQEVLDTIGATIYTNRFTGLIDLKLIRDDYTVGSLPAFSPDSGLLAIEDDDNGATARAANEVQVTYRSPVDNEDHQIRVRNAGAIRAAGGRVATTAVEYIGVPTAALAARLAQRDLVAGSGYLKRFRVRLDRRGSRIQAGDPFVVTDPSRRIQMMVLRAGRVEYSTDDGSIVVTAVQDAFALRSTSYMAYQPGTWVGPDTTPQQVTVGQLVELSYRDVARGIDAANLALLTDTSAYLGSIAKRPTSLSLGYMLRTRVGSSGSFVDRVEAVFTPSATLSAALPAAEGPAVVTLLGADMLDLVTLGSAAMIDDEILRVTAVNIIAQTVTLARGCADTVPAPHAAGARVWFYDDYSFADPNEYVSGVSMQAKLITHTNSGQIEEASAPTLLKTLGQRFGSPYPPGRVRVNAQAYPAMAERSLTVSWAHRDRIAQADQLVDAAEASIGPEAGTTYSVRVTRVDTSAVLYSTTAVAGTSQAIPTLAYDGDVKLEVWSVRSALPSLQRATHTFTYLRTEALLAEDGDTLVTEAGELLITED
jgi:hypothetical protein